MDEALKPQERGRPGLLLQLLTARTDQMHGTASAVSALY